MCGQFYHLKGFADKKRLAINVEKMNKTNITTVASNYTNGRRK